MFTQGLGEQRQYSYEEKEGIITFKGCMRACVWRYFIIQSLSPVWLFATPWTAACQASLSFIASQGLLMSIESVMSSNHLILCRPLLLLPSIFPQQQSFPMSRFFASGGRNNEGMEAWKNMMSLSGNDEQFGQSVQKKIIERKAKTVFWRASYVWRERLDSTLGKEGRHFEYGSHVLLVVFKDSHLAAVHRMVWSETGKSDL